MSDINKQAPQKNTHFLHGVFHTDQRNHPMPQVWAKSILQKILTFFSENTEKRSH